MAPDLSAVNWAKTYTGNNGIFKSIVYDSANDRVYAGGHVYNYGSSINNLAFARLSAADGTVL